MVIHFVFHGVFWRLDTDPKYCCMVGSPAKTSNDIPKEYIWYDQAMIQQDVVLLKRLVQDVTCDMCDESLLKL